MFYLLCHVLLCRGSAINKRSEVLKALCDNSRFWSGFCEDRVAAPGASWLSDQSIQGRQIGDYETMNLPSIEDAEEMAEDAEAFREATRAYLIRLGYGI